MQYKYIPEMLQKYKGLLEESETIARILTFTKDDVAARQSKVLTSQLQIANLPAFVLIDCGVTHSFTSRKFAEGESHACNVLNEGLSTSLPSGEILLSSHWLQVVLVVFSRRELLAVLVILTMQDYNVILGIDFLGKYNAMIECQSKRVIFRPPSEVVFEYSEIITSNLRG